MKERLKEARNRSVGDERLLGEAVKNLASNGFTVYVVNGLEEAYSRVLSEIGHEKIVVKSKSNISKEMMLAERLAKAGIKAVETDIGDRILQFAKGRPSHPTGPVSHMSVESVSRLLSAQMGKDVPPEAASIIDELKKDIKGAIERAKIGITGANAVCAAEGAVVIIHNEGNVSEISRLQGKHIIITDTNKIYPSIEEALNMVKLQTYCATGALTTSYINIVSGLSKTADIEKKLSYGVHGPERIVLILIKRPPPPAEARESSYCIGCGACLLDCPVFHEKGGAFGAGYRQGGIGVIQSYISEGADAGIDNGLYSCTKCGACVPRCPVSIDTPRIIGSLREMAAGTERLKGRLRPFRIVADSLVYAERVKGSLGIFRKKRPADAEVAYFPGCVATVSTPGLKRDVSSLIELATGSKPHVIEGCCGGVWESLGFGGKFKRTFEGFVRRLGTRPARRIIVSCPHCYEIVWLRNREAMVNAGVTEVVRLTEALNEAGIEAGGAEDQKKLAYHDSCLFGRGMGIYDEPRKLMKAAFGSENIVEMKGSGENSRCCGFSLTAHDPASAAGMAQKIADDARCSGADKLVTSGCPGCYYALKGVSGIEVEDISSLLLKNLRARKMSDADTVRNVYGHR